jgi:Flp pilus assembly protein TadD
MAMAVVDTEKGTDKREASALIVAWADAYYLKGYALVELRRSEDAKVALERAIHLSPFNSQYLSELANIYQDEKNWPKAFDLYSEAEAFATFSPSTREKLDTARAKRGQGYVLTELGRLDEAEAKYKECLAMDPNDAKAQHELEYIRAVRATSK